MKRFYDVELNDTENEKLEELLKDTPTFEEFEALKGYKESHGIADNNITDEYDKKYGDIIRDARDKATE